METVLCRNCRHYFTFDPRKIWNSPVNAESEQSSNSGIVLVPCPKCQSLRTFLVDPQEAAPANGSVVSAAPAALADLNDLEAIATSVMPAHETPPIKIAEEMSELGNNASSERLRRLRDEGRKSREVHCALQETALVNVKRLHELLAQIKDQLRCCSRVR